MNVLIKRLIILNVSNKQEKNKDIFYMKRKLDYPNMKSLFVLYSVTSPRFNGLIFTVV